MADETTKTPDEQLLEDILNELDMTLADESMQKKIKDIMQRGKARIEKIGGKQLDFSKNQQARELLFSYCRYGRSNAIEQFEHDFSSQLTGFALDEALATLESGAENESKV